MKKATAVLLIIAMLSALLCGCGEKTARSSNSGTENPGESSGGSGVVTENINADVRITELMSSNSAFLMTRNGLFPDWVELCNEGDDSVDLSGWYLSDNEDKPKKWQIESLTLAPGERTVIFCTGDQAVKGEADFALSASGECIILTAANGRTMDKASFGESEDNFSFVREGGEMQVCRFPTPGYENTNAGYIEYQKTLTPPAVLQINEVMVSNREFFGDYLHGYQDWVELKNISSQPVELSDYWISDTDKDFRQWQLPDRTLGPGEMFLVLCDGRDDRKDELPGASFSLNSENEELYLSDKNGVVDYAALHDITDEGSYGRIAGENGWFWFPTPSPRKENSGGARCISAQPISLTKDGIYNDVKNVTVELQAAGEIHYSLDGSAPTSDSPLYSEPLVLDKTTVVRAVSLEENALPSRPLTLSYIINENHSLPVLSLASDDPQSFSGMYWGPSKLMEEPSNLSMYDGNGKVFSIGCGVKMNGETSLELAKKNMALRFRGCYGADKLKCDLYGGGVTEFSDLLLRAGQDFTRAIVRNELCQELAEKASDSIINQRSIWCVLYINGQYWGIYTLKERANARLYAAIAGVSEDSVELFEASAPPQSSFATEVLDYCIQNDMSDPEKYEELCRRLDIDSLIDWTILESFCANVDLTTGNLRYVHSSEDDGKWRLMFYDLDSTFDSTGGGFENLMSVYAYENRQVSILCRKLLESEEYRDRFLTRAAKLFSTVLTSEGVIEELDRQCAIIEDEVPRDLGRFGRTVEDWEYSQDKIRDFVSSSDSGVDWVQHCIDMLCELMDLSGSEREFYFGK